MRAFQDEVRGKIHIRKEKADLGTQLHEGLHLFSDDRWKKTMNYQVNEGVTEYFTRKLAPEVKVERDDNSFLREYTSATHLVAAAGEQVVAAAYFDGDIASLQDEDRRAQARRRGHLEEVARASRGAEVQGGQRAPHDVVARSLTAMTTIETLGPAPLDPRARQHLVPMRDGVRLATDVYLPEGPGPFPAVLVRLPYDKNGRYCWMPFLATHFIARGYAFVPQDVRGGSARRASRSHS